MNNRLKAKRVQFIILCIMLFSYSIFAVNISSNSCSQSFLNERIQSNKFNTDRGLRKTFIDDGYISAFGKQFERKLFALNTDNLWIDMGAGRGNAIKEYYQEGGVAKSIAVVVEPDRGLKTVIRKNKKSSLISGDYIENVDVSKLHNQVDVITDFYGPLSYSIDLTQALDTYFKLLKVDGSIFLKYSRGSIDYARIKLDFSTSITLERFLEKIDGVKVIKHSQLTKSGIQIVKTKDSIKVPLLKLVDLSSGAPPYRTFRSVK